MLSRSAAPNDMAESKAAGEMSGVTALLDSKEMRPFYFKRVNQLM